MALVSFYKYFNAVPDFIFKNAPSLLYWKKIKGIFIQILWDPFSETLKISISKFMTGDFPEIFIILRVLSFFIFVKNICILTLT